MKTSILFLLTLFCVGRLRADTYYFSSTSGNDAYSPSEAQSEATPWKTLARLNSYFTQLKPGDQVLFLRGDVFDGSIQVQRSGTVGQPIRFGAYGAGNKPVINGFSTLSGWTNQGNGIFQTALPPADGTPNMIRYNGNAQPLGRFPNADAPMKGYLNFESHNGNTQITDNQLFTATDWTGAELVIRKNRWITERAAITRHDGNNIYYAAVSGWQPIDHYGYFIQNHLQTLDQKGEWYVDRNNKTISVYFNNDNPQTQQVQVNTLPWLLNIVNQQYLSFEGITFQGANESSIILDNASSIQFLSCDVIFSANDAIIASNTNDIRISSCLIENTFNNGLTGNNCNNTVLRENYFRNTGIYAGMGKNDGSYEAIILKGTNNLIELNYFDQTGYVPITFNGDQTIVRQNVINHFSFVKDDGGGIYTWNNYPEKRTFHDQQIVDNIILNGYGAGEGTSDPEYRAASGIYLDDNTSNVIVKGNTVAHCALSGIYIHNGHELHLEQNTLYNNELQLQIRQDEAGNAPVRNNFIYNNILLSKTPQQYVSKVESTLNDIGSFGNINGNYYCRPLNEEYPIFTSYGSGGQIIGQTFNLAGWTARYQFDQTTKTSPVQIPAYQPAATTGVNKFPNGGFQDNINGLYCYASTGNCNTNWRSTGMLDGGCLQYTYQPAAGAAASSSYIIIDIGGVTAGRSYLVKFSTRSSIENKKLGVFLRQSQGGYQDITARTYLTAGINRKEHELVFTPGADESATSLVFELEENEGLTCWFDNIEVRQADVVKTDPDDYLRFEYNGSREAKTIALNGNYVDARSQKYTGSITLQPFSSAVLIRNDETILPLQITSFKANPVAEQVNLQWVTAGTGESEIFGVERSGNGRDFHNIGHLPAASKNGAEGPYRYVDVRPLTGNNFYRIRHKDATGNASHTPVVLVKNLSKDKIRLSPNPARAMMEVALDIPGNTGALQLQVENMNGVVIRTIPLNHAQKSVLINTTDLKAGTYLLRAIGSDFVISKKFTVF